MKFPPVSNTGTMSVAQPPARELNLDVITIEILSDGTSLMAQWLRIRLPMQRTLV